MTSRSRPAPSGQLFTFRMVPLIAADLVAAGVDAAAMVEAAGLPSAALHGEITAPLGRVQRFVGDAAHALDRDLYGAELAARVPAGAFGVAEFLMRAAPTVGAALEALTRVAALINPLGQFRVVETATGRALHYSVAAERDALGTHLNEYSLHLFVAQISAIQGKALALTSAWFPHRRAQASAVALAGRLGCPLRFTAPDVGFELAHETVHTPLRTADPALYAFMQRQAQAALGVSANSDIVTHLVRTIESRLPDGDLDADAVAKAMTTTSRSLQRRLAEAGTTYRKVLAHVRRRRAEELRQAGHVEGDIARALGFSDARSMRRSLSEAESA